MTDLFAGFPGVRRWRQLLSPPYKKFARASDILRAGMDLFPDAILDSTDWRPPAPEGRGLPGEENRPTL